MIIKDNFSKFTNISKLSGCIAFFTNEKSEITHLKKFLSSSDYKNLTVLLKNKNKKKGLLSFDLNPNQKIILISLKKNQKPNLNLLCLKVLQHFGLFYQREYLMQLAPSIHLERAPTPYHRKYPLDM